MKEVCLPGKEENQGCFDPLGCKQAKNFRLNTEQCGKPSSIKQGIPWPWKWEENCSLKRRSSPNLRARLTTSLCTCGPRGPHTCLLLPCHGCSFSSPSPQGHCLRLSLPRDAPAKSPRYGTRFSGKLVLCERATEECVGSWLSVIPDQSPQPKMAGHVSALKTLLGTPVKWAKCN